MSFIVLVSSWPIHRRLLQFLLKLLWVHLQEFFSTVHSQTPKLTACECCSEISRPDRAHPFGKAKISSDRLDILVLSRCTSENPGATQLLLLVVCKFQICSRHAQLRCLSA